MNVNDFVHCVVFSNAIISVVAFVVDVLFFDDTDMMALCWKMCRGTQKHVNVIWAKSVLPENGSKGFLRHLSGLLVTNGILQCCAI